MKLPPGRLLPQEVARIRAYAIRPIPLRQFAWYDFRHPSITVRYRVKTAILAVKAVDDGEFRFVTLREGSALEIIGVVQPSGLVFVRYEGRLLAAFACDIEDRAERIQAASA